MRALRWFIVGSVAGLMLGLVVLSSLYVSPWRQAIYLFADPKVGAVRHKLQDFQTRIREQESRMAFAGDSLAALKASQDKHWQEYRAWRNRFGQMANAHKSKSPTDFLAWSSSLVVWVLPGTLLFFFGGGLLSLFLVMRQEERFPVLAPRPRRALEPSAPTQPLDQFQEAVRRIADIQSRSPIRQKNRNETQVASPAPVAAEPEPKSKGMGETLTDIPRHIQSVQGRGPSNSVPSPWAMNPEQTQVPTQEPAQAAAGKQAKPRSTEPKVTEPATPPQWQEAEAQLPPGMSLHPPRLLTPEDTTYLDVLSGWEDMAQTAQTDMPPPPLRPSPGVVSPAARLQEPPALARNPLTMEDEDNGEGFAAHSADQNLESENPYSIADLGPSEPVYGRMPETTEFEKVERQKMEVVKLARKGLTTSEISRRLKMSEDQVDLIVRMRRERG